MRAVRNFWIEADIDGRKARLASGPRRKNGGFRLTVRVRADGDSDKALDIEGIAMVNGNLKIIVSDKYGNDIYTSITRRG